MLLGSGPTDSARSNGASPVFAILFAGRRRPKNRDWTRGRRSTIRSVSNWQGWLSHPYLAHFVSSLIRLN
jgi:hypothetical protein